MPRSLFGRLVIVQVTVAMLLAALLPLLISHLLTSTTDAFVGRELDRRAAMVRQRIGYGPSGWAFTGPVPRMFDSKAGIHNAKVVDSAGRILLDQGPGYAIPFTELPLGQTHEHRLWNGIDIVTDPIESNGHPAWLVISADRRHPESLVANVATTFLTRFLWIVPALILCTLILTLLFFAHATAAIRRASRRADDIDGDTLGLRLDIDELPLEVLPLARAVNQALDRVQESYSAQTEFAGNVAHELRNPLATIACRIEEIADPTLRELMCASVDHAAHIVDQLMMLARLGGEKPVLGAIDLRALTIATIADIAPRIIGNGRTIEFDDQAVDIEVTADGNEGLTQLSLSNLIDNAHRHTPHGTHIRVSLAAGPRLLVEDDGPGIASCDRDRVRDRFWRADNLSSDGAGLGLSIVSKAMSAQHGSLEICETVRGAMLALNFRPRTASGDGAESDRQLTLAGRVACV